MFDTLEEILSPVHADYHQEFFSEINSTESDPHHIVASSNTDNVTQEYFRRLRDGVYLNDEIINYIIMLEKIYDHKCFLRHHREKLSHIFSSLKRVNILMKM